MKQAMCVCEREIGSASWEFVYCISRGGAFFSTKLRQSDARPCRSYPDRETHTEREGRKDWALRYQSMVPFCFSASSIDWLDRWISSPMYFRVLSILFVQSDEEGRMSSFHFSSTTTSLIHMMSLLEPGLDHGKEGEVQ